MQLFAEVDLMLDNSCAFTGHRPHKLPWRYCGYCPIRSEAGQRNHHSQSDHARSRRGSSRM